MYVCMYVYQGIKPWAYLSECNSSLFVLVNGEILIIIHYTGSSLNMDWRGIGREKCPVGHIHRLDGCFYDFMG